MQAGILPLKGPERSKARLGVDLDVAARRAIAEALIEDALALCEATPELRWWVVSDELSILETARLRGFSVLQDAGTGLNEALSIAIEEIAAEGAASVLVIPVDVPLATPEDIRDLLDTGATSDVVVVPSERDGGTNALYLSPPDLMPPRFGPGSLAAHVATADERGLRCSVLALERIALDIDTVEDVDRLLDRGPVDRRTYEVCLRLRRAPAP